MPNLTQPDTRTENGVGNIHVGWLANANALIVVFLASVGNLSAAIISDEFSGTALNAAWTITSPNPSSSVGLTGTGALRLSASPANGGSDLGGNYNAPRVLQSTDGVTDWMIETKFDFSPTNDYQGAGILLKTGPNDTDVSRIAERAYFPGGGGNVVRSVGGYVGYSGSTTYLRVQKQANNYTGWWSSDGATWTLSGTSTSAATVSSFGVFTISQNWSGGTPISVSDFDYFHVIVIPEPSISAMLIGGVAGLSWLRRRQTAA